jgi:hypothetical protein
MADKLLLVTTFVVLTLPGLNLANRLPLWLTILIISRDVVIVLTVAIVNLAIGRRTFLPSMFGKVATATYIVTCGVRNAVQLSRLSFAARGRLHLGLADDHAGLGVSLHLARASDYRGAGGMKDGCRVLGAWCWVLVSGAWCGVLGAGCGVLGAGCGVRSAGCWVLALVLGAWCVSAQAVQTKVVQTQVVPTQVVPTQVVVRRRYCRRRWCRSRRWSKPSQVRSSSIWRLMPRRIKPRIS